MKTIRRGENRDEQLSMFFRYRAAAIQDWRILPLFQNDASSKPD